MRTNKAELRLDGYSYLAGMYYPFGNLISFPRYNLNNIWGRKLKYDLSPTEFKKNIKLIERLLVYHHEHTHLYQTMGTLNGFFLYENLLSSATIIFTLCEKSRYALPLIKFLSTGGEGAKLKEIDFERYYHFIRGLYYKFLIDWNQGSHQCYLLPTNPGDHMGFWYEIENVPFVNETFDKAFEISAKPIPRVFASAGKDKAYTMFLGSFSLMESFAKSVEFEHLIWFNRNESDKYIDKYNTDPRNLIYTFPMMLFQSETSDYYESLNYHYAVFRIICDIALMNQSSILNDHTTNYVHRPNDEPYLTCNTQPGDTFLRTLAALRRVPPLKDHQNDIMRFYDNLCEEIGILTHEEIVNRAISAIGNRLNKFTNDWVGQLFTNYLKVMQLRKQYPLFFINDLIYADKAEDMLSNFKKFISYVDTRQQHFVTSNEFNSNTTLVALLADILYQLLLDNKVSCNYEELFGICKKKGKRCINTFPGRTPLTPRDCIYFNLIQPIYKNAVLSEE